MAAARHRHSGRGRRSSDGGLPGWVWLILGAALTLAVVVLGPRYFKPGEGDGFFRAPPDTAAQPPISALEQPAPAVNPPAAAPAPAPVASLSSTGRSASTDRPAPAAPPAEPDYDFYTVLPAPDASALDRVDAAAPADSADAAELAAPHPAATAPTPAAARTPPPASPASPPPASPPVADIPAPRPAAPAPLPRPPASSTRTAATAPVSAPATARPAAPAATSANSQPALLQVGAFRTADDAEALKARIALLGLQARVEAGTVDGQSVYRVRLGPYPSARELAAARQRLDEGGLPSREIRSGQ